jgi:protein-tyrosine phosphatase
LIDIHSHILWGLDDGSGSFETSLEMVRLAVESGTTDIVATPHANLEYKFQPELITERIAQLSAAAGPAPRIHRGCDFHFYPDHVALALKEPSRFTINGKRYLLIEFSDLLIFKETAEMIQQLQKARLTCILTHPERNYLLHHRMESLAAWVDCGLQLQVTAQSFLGRFGTDVKKFSDELMRRGMVHFVASDAHDTRDRPPRLDTARDYVRKKFGEAWAEHLFVINPGAVVSGDLLPPLPELPAPRKWWQVLGR